MSGKNTAFLPAETALPVSQLRGMISDLFHHRPAIYWVDFLTSSAMGWSAYALSLALEDYRIIRIACLIVAAAALYRALSFSHELAHLPRRTLPGFRLAWNLFCGIPLFLPDFMYRSVHLSHHAKKTYNTQRDAEYIPLGSGHPCYILISLIATPILPVLLLIRFAILTPLSLINCQLRAWIEKKASALAMRWDYIRDIPARRDDRIQWYWQEAGVSLLALTIAGLLLSGSLPSEVVLHWYAVFAMIAVMNHIRALGATHRYCGNQQEMSFTDQVFDSVNVDSRSLSALLLCPVGLRFHALHHLFPSLPYHSLGAAHRRLLEHLPANSPYRDVNIPSVWAGCGQLWREASQSQMPAEQRVASNHAVTTTR